MKDFIKRVTLSSTGSGVALRIKSFAFLVVPVLNEYMKDWGVTLVNEQVEIAIDVAMWVAFGFAHAYGWLRALRK